MTRTREIPLTEGQRFLPAFSEQHQRQPVRLETTVPPGEGEPVLTEYYPLLGVEADLKGSAAPAIIVTLGGLAPDMPAFTHVIARPTRLWIAERDDGVALALEIESKDEGRTRILFEPPALPEPPAPSRSE